MFGLQITTKLRVGAEVGVAASLLCLMRQLESIAAARQIHFTTRDRRLQRTVDLVIGIGGPVLVMILHVVVQGHRYDIIQRVGCIPAIYFSLPAIFLMSIWPPILMGIAAVYGGKHIPI